MKTDERRETAASRAGSGLLPVSDARARIVSALPVIDEETVPLSACFGRVLAAGPVAAVSHPPTAISAMDGYALRRADAGALPVSLRKIGAARAGEGFSGRIEAGQG